MKTKSRRRLTGTWTMATIGFALSLLLASAETTKAQWTTNGNDVYKTNTSGNVGVGMTSPVAKVDITTIPYDSLENIKANISSNAINLSSSYNGSSYAPGITWTPTNLSTIHPAAGIWAFMGGSGSYLHFGTTNSYGGITNTAMTIDYNGNVGIGTTSPQRTLQITASNAVGILDSNSQYELYIGQSSSLTRIGPTYRSGGAFVPLTFWTSDTERVRVDTAGNVGIGTTSPTAPLHVQFAGDKALKVETTSASTGVSRIQAIGPGSQSQLSLEWREDIPGGMALIQTGKSNNSPNLGILSGNVGIGTTAPGYKLDVNGNTNVTGNLNITANGTGTGNIVAAGTINAKYQDVAEWVPSSEQLSAGTVVVLDSTKSNQVTSSSVSYDTRVAGVVSEQPGIALGEKSDTKVLVATTGRVKVKVDASKGAIHIGDLLVTSDVPGVAMKSEPIEFAGRKMHMPGTLIGKALEPLEKGKGEILVLLSLQ